MKMLKQFAIVVTLAFLLNACSQPQGDFPGSEYMPDMAHSTAYEANTYNYYYYNTWDERSSVDRAALTYPRYTVKGTVPRGFAGVYFAQGEEERVQMQGKLNGEGSQNAIAVPVNGHVPYYYEDTEEERTRATAELIDNPFPITEAGLAQGKLVYDLFCAICHGEKGDGQGWLVSEDNPNVVYPVQPAILNNDEFTAASNGRFYHAIMYGKNVMGGYADKMSYQERWEVIHYIRSLQAADDGLEYSPEVNTLNPEFGTPAVAVSGQLANQVTDTVAAMGAALPMEAPHNDEEH